MPKEFSAAILGQNVRVGMSRETVAAVCGDAIKNQHPRANRWHVKSSRPYTANLYFIAFHDDLKAIILRGRYFVFP